MYTQLPWLQLQVIVYHNWGAQMAGRILLSFEWLQAYGNSYTKQALTANSKHFWSWGPRRGMYTREISQTSTLKPQICPGNIHLGALGLSHDRIRKIDILCTSVEDIWTFNPWLSKDDWSDKHLVMGKISLIVESLLNLQCKESLPDLHILTWNSNPVFSFCRRQIIRVALIDIVVVGTCLSGYHDSSGLV